MRTYEKMKIQERTILEMVNMLNNPNAEGGGIWLPGIQRTFVWNVEQICNLFDSILRNYPISIFLLWKTKNNVRYRKFIDCYNKNISLNHLFMRGNKNSKSLVLDGQQRLQSLYIGLKGDYEGKELYFNLYSVGNTSSDDMKYEFSFEKEDKIKFPWIKFKDLVAEESDPFDVTDKIIKTANVPDDKKNIVGRNISQVLHTFSAVPIISYHELDSIKFPKLYSENEVVEIFIRANSAGTALNKSDLLLSLLNSSWEKANVYIENLLDKINKNGFKFTKDFVLKLCLTLLNQGAKYEVSKFRKKGIMEDIEKNWINISEALYDVLDYVQENTYIKSHKAMLSYLALIPMVYARYHYKNSWGQSKDKNYYLIRTLICGVFSGTPDHLIDRIVDNINENKGFVTSQIFDVIKQRGRSLEISPDRLFLNFNYGSRLIHLLFNLWYEKSFFEPLYKNNTLEIDHIFPRSRLREMSLLTNKSEGKSSRTFSEEEINQLANCMLLSRKENGPSEKSDLLPEVWLKNKPDSFFELHSIPRDENLWKIENFIEFVEKRKNLILDRCNFLLTKNNESLENRNSNISRYEPVAKCKWKNWEFDTFDSNSTFKIFPGIFIFSYTKDNYYKPIYIGQSTVLGRRVSIVKSNNRHMYKNSQHIHILEVSNAHERNKITNSLKELYNPEINLINL